MPVRSCQLAALFLPVLLERAADRLELPRLTRSVSRACRSRNGPAPCASMMTVVPPAMSNSSLSRLTVQLCVTSPTRSKATRPSGAARRPPARTGPSPDRRRSTFFGRGPNGATRLNVLACLGLVTSRPERVGLTEQFALARGLSRVSRESQPVEREAGDAKAFGRRLPPDRVFGHEAARGREKSGGGGTSASAPRGIPTCRSVRFRCRR